MTVRQVIEESESLPPEQQRQVFLHFQEKDGVPDSSPPVRYLDRAAARPLIKESLTEHSELLRKLAQ